MYENKNFDQNVLSFFQHGKMSLWLQVTPSVKGIVKLLNLSTDPKVSKSLKEDYIFTTFL
jgi:hypothetical protein